MLNYVYKIGEVRETEGIHGKSQPRCKGMYSLFRCTIKSIKLHTCNIDIAILIKHYSHGHVQIKSDISLNGSQPAPWLQYELGTNRMNGWCEKGGRSFIHLALFVVIVMKSLSRVP